MEIWDLYDDNRQLTGETMVRGDAFPPNRYHIIIGVWTIHLRLRRVLITLRHPGKRICPNCWENTGGSLLAGESSPVAAAREIHEETGMICEPEDLILIAQLRTGYSFVDCFIRYTDIDPDSIILQEDETIDYRWVTLEEIDELIEEGTFTTAEIPQYHASLYALHQALAHSNESACAIINVPNPMHLWHIRV